MALKAILGSLEGLSADVQKEYVKGEDGKFHLDVDGIEEHPKIGALKRAKDREAEDAKNARTRITELTDERDNILKGAIPKNDVEKLENSYKSKLSDLEKTYKGQLESVNTSLHTLLVDNVAQQIASSISKVPELLIPHIRGRLKAEIVEGKPFTRVLDKDGGLSAASIEDFKKELIANPTFAPILIGSKASGSSASTKAPAGSAAITTKSLAAMTPSELAAHMTALKQGG